MQQVIVQRDKDSETDNTTQSKRSMMPSHIEWRKRPAITPAPPREKFPYESRQSGYTMTSESEVSWMQNQNQDQMKIRNQNGQKQTEGQNPQNKKKDQAQNKSHQPNQF